NFAMLRIPLRECLMFATLTFERFAETFKHSNGRQPSNSEASNRRSRQTFQTAKRQTGLGRQTRSAA
ncbi:MAG: hypothetical protein JXR62_06695, partial [Bacilli bacterium]|nr:hypothetical protein [Bacilli bacterium]